MNVERRDVKVDVDIIVDILRNRIGEQNATTKFPAYIRKAPSTLRKHSPSSFTPRVVSIGPLHRKDKNLQRFEVRKAAYVRALLSEQTLTACVEKVASIIENIRSCYDTLKGHNDNKLTEMMVMDACFILNFIHMNSTESILRLQGQEQYIPYDLVLLENQIPFFVLIAIYECVKSHLEEPSLTVTEFIHPLLKYVNLFEGRVKVSSHIPSNNQYKHILGYLHHCYRPRKDIPSAFPSSTIHSAVELDRAGVNFKPKDDKPKDAPKWPMAMEVKKNHSRIFWFLRKCTLIMPKLHIDDFTELVFRNLIAYEQSYVAKPYVTSYARAMNMLIDTNEDVAKLVRSKVIVNHIGSNEEAANMINMICKEVVPKHFYYTQQWKQLDKNFEGYWPKKIVNLKRTYFHSPWSIIALFAGIVLFVLALLQTIFTIKSS